MFLMGSGSVEAPSPVPSGESMLAFIRGSSSVPAKSAVTVVEVPSGNIDEVALISTVGGGGAATESIAVLEREVSGPCAVQE